MGEGPGRLKSLSGVPGTSSVTGVDVWWEERTQAVSTRPVATSL